MAVVYPIIFTNILDNEVLYKRSTSEETIKKFVHDINMQSKFAPIGTIRCIQLNQSGVQVPDPNIWQLCEGGEIVHPTSPLRSVGLILRFAPDMRNHYLRGTTDTNNNLVGGAATINLRHSHGGATGSLEGPIRGEEGNEKTARVNHSHPINDDLSDVEPLNPAYQELAFYIKIN